MVQYALGFQTSLFCELVFEEKDFIWEAGESKKNAATARFHLFSRLNFQKRG
jgi:hypothetical protein